MRGSAVRGLQHLACSALPCIWRDSCRPRRPQTARMQGVRHWLVLRSVGAPAEGWGCCCSEEGVIPAARGRGHLGGWWLPPIHPTWAGGLMLGELLGQQCGAWGVQVCACSRAPPASTWVGHQLSQAEQRRVIGCLSGCVLPWLYHVHSDWAVAPAPAGVSGQTCTALQGALWPAGGNFKCSCCMQHSLFLAYVA
jgi:hypothetical protein